MPIDTLRAMKVFVRIYERKSFTLAADDLNMPRATLTHTINALEAHLGARLLERSTRRVEPTLDGDAYYERCLHLLAEIEDAENAFRTVAPKGLLRVNLQGSLARQFVIPALPAFMERFPDIELAVSEADRFVDLVREGVDCVLRAGTLGDSSLTGRRVATLRQATCASVGYVQQYGQPDSLDDLAAHRAINYVSSTGRRYPFEFMVEGTQTDVEIGGRVTVSGAEVYTAAGLAGLGMIQVPRYRIAALLDAGTLIELLPQHPPPPMPVSVLYPQSRHMSPRVRVFVDWLTQVFADAKAAGTL
ncbi:DNA-binding transcriptional LysR family regulator [Pigmentiphaga litoralis]|uniref:DNA-binding transcriptional LysR family regulator n=1 Tax=Pigmentiphaga litoralis TaxID=516702 RepID=A0A7Y9IS34_9BURK|nr:LysR family transcriptional regulator [Pigmentiphaga litoralis]NYE24355.1 DNA-binding transcriptional LysR family regulator [Pigmentiphaga litoralis]NYE82031.1 DNA-binding transcriptional LysR family regulator [Pigmentiphaga litoralis]